MTELLVFHCNESLCLKITLVCFSLFHFDVLFVLIFLLFCGILLCTDKWINVLSACLTCDN